MKKYLFFATLFLASNSIFSQITISDNNPKYKKDFGWVMAYGIGNVLSENLHGIDTTHCIDAFFIIRFKIDSTGNVCDIQFSNDTAYEKEGASYSGFDASVRKKINHDIDSVLRKTSGSWIPAKKNGTPCLSKPLAIIISCNRSFRRDCYVRPDLIDTAPAFHEEECIIFSSFRWFGDYKR